MTICDSKNNLSMHPLVQEVIKLKWNLDDSLRFTKWAVFLMIGMFPRDACPSPTYRHGEWSEQLKNVSSLVLKSKSLKLKFESVEYPHGFIEILKHVVLLFTRFRQFCICGL